MERRTGINKPSAYTKRRREEEDINKSQRPAFERPVMSILVPKAVNNYFNYCHLLTLITQSKLPFFHCNVQYFINHSFKFSQM